MSHAIPEPFVWDKSFAVFYAKLDEEHKGLFQGIFACCEANNAANLATLKLKVNDHFVSEEADLKKVRNILYPLIFFMIRIFMRILMYCFCISIYVVM